VITALFFLSMQMATHHACDDWDKMIKGDAGMYMNEVKYLLLLFEFCIKLIFSFWLLFALL